MVVQKVLRPEDFNWILHNYAGRELTHIPVTKTTSNYTGEEILTEGTPVSIVCYVMKTSQNWAFKEQGFLEKGDCVGLFEIPDTIRINSIIILNGEKFRVKEAFDVPGVYDAIGDADELVYTAANLFLIDDE